MNPLLQEALGSVVRWALSLLVPFLVSAGIWTTEDATKYVAAAALAILALGWSLWQKYKSRLTLVTALASPKPMTENTAKSIVAQGASPSATTPTTEVPQSL